MAHEIKSVSNQAVLDALRIRGLQFPANFDISGAQNSTFARRVFDHLRNSGQQYPPDIFSSGITTAKDLEVINRNPDWTADEKFLRTLKAYGISDDQVHQIYEEAKNDPTNRGGINQGGKEVSDLAWQTVTRRVLGDVPVVQEAERRAGLTPPAQAVPQPAAPSRAGTVTQAIPSPAKAPVAKIGGPKMGIAGPGLKAPAAGAGAKTPGGAATAPGTATAVTPGADKPTDPFPTDPSKVRDWVARNNPEWLFLLDIPEVANIIKDPSTWEEGADDADLRGRLMQTQWWQKTEPAAREWLKLKAQDPASSNDQLAKRKTFLKNQAQQTGITVADADLDRLAEDSLRYAWDDTEIQANLGNYFVYAEDRLTGAAQAARAHIEQAARDWLVPIDDKTVGNWVTQVIKGESTTDYFDTYLAQQAGSLFPQLADPISRGISPTQWMAPYKSIAAQTLELNPEDIDLRDPKWMRAVSQVDDKGGRSAMSLYDWTNLIKTDDSYGFDKTQQGRDHGASLARNIAAQFGFATGGGL